MRSLVLHFVATVVIATPVHLLAGESEALTSRPPSRVIGREMAPFLKEANDAARRKDWDVAAAQLAKADAVPNKTEYEQSIIDALRRYVLIKTSVPAFREKSKSELLLERKPQ
jgi:hypothetical protein